MSPEVNEGPVGHADVEKTAAQETAHHVQSLNSDEDLLASLGYKQELKRNFAMSEVFGISFAIIGLLASIASTLSFSIPGGPAAMTWGWFLAGGAIFLVGVSLADLSSAMPTCGGLYFWTHHYAPPKLKNPLSFLVGYSNTLGLVGGICSVDYGFALEFTSVISIARDGNWSPSRGELYAVFVCCVLVHGSLATVGARIMGRLQTVFVAVNLILVFATIIALPIGTGSKRNDAHYIFVTTENLTTWPSGWAFMLAWLSPIWTISCFDSCVHMSEEASNAAKAVPYGIMMATGSTWILGWIVLIVIAACINPDLASVVGTSSGQPMAQIYYDALGKNGALGFMSLLMFTQFLMGLSIVVAASRQTWAFCRDGALPFSGFFRVISVKFGYSLPFRAIWGCVFLAIVLGLLCLIATAAANALFSLLIIGNNVAYIVPIFCRVVWGDKSFVPGPFYTGRRASKPIAWFAIVFLLFGVILAMFPDGGPSPTAETMNYAVVISMPVWGGSLLYYYVDAYKWFKGPKHTIEMEAVITEAEREQQMGDVPS